MSEHSQSKMIVMVTQASKGDCSWHNTNTRLKIDLVAGWYYIAAQQGVLSVGDSVEIAKTRTGPPQQWGA